jgi:DNA mismatch repair protein MutL
LAAIRLLSDQLINRIAAGEVVERPASVLKELIENSLDAGADRLEIEVAAGGVKYLSIADNGCGMDRDDLLLAVERHATSKLTEETDLLHIGTLGFRGEALPSIAAVSRLTITTSAGDDGAGRRLRISGGRVMGLDEAARGRGTTIEVQDLFFNVPARRKFLKSPATEAAHLLETVQRYALSRSDLRLVYRHDGQELLSTSPRENDQTRLAKVVGRENARLLFPFEGQKGDIRLSGFLGRPDLERSRTSGLYLFVNGRPVKDRLMTRAVLDAYRGRLPGGRYPIAMVFLEIDPALVDANVHPTKAEVRFRQPGEIFQAAVELMAQALSEKLRPVSRDAFERPETSDPRYNQAPPEYAAFDFAPAGSVGETTVWTQSEIHPPPAFAPVPAEAGENEEVQGGLKPIGQLFRSYILAQGADGLYVVDQHAAHERILYEKLQTGLENGRMPSQALLMPETIELTPVQTELMNDLVPRLERFGFDLEPFGGRTFVVRSVPAVLAERDPRQVLDDIIDLAAEHRPGRGLERIEEHMTASLACHGAIKANQSLTLDEMQRLLDDLDRTRVPTNCPHGRPLIFKLDRREIEKRFQR